MKAFPLSNMTGLNQQGMDLRDYFAAKAMGAILAADPEPNTNDPIAELSIAAYAVADAMMQARETK